MLGPLVHRLGEGLGKQFSSFVQGDKDGVRREAAEERFGFRSLDARSVSSLPIRRGLRGIPGFERGIWRRGRSAYDAHASRCQASGSLPTARTMIACPHQSGFLRLDEKPGRGGREDPGWDDGSAQAEALRRSLCRCGSAQRNSVKFLPELEAPQHPFTECRSGRGDACRIPMARENPALAFLRYASRILPIRSARSSFLSLDRSAPSQPRSTWQQRQRGRRGRRRSRLRWEKSGPLFRRRGHLAERCQDRWERGLRLGVQRSVPGWDFILRTSGGGFSRFASTGGVASHCRGNSGRRRIGVRWLRGRRGVLWFPSVAVRPVEGRAIGIRASSSGTSVGSAREAWSTAARMAESLSELARRSISHLRQLAFERRRFLAGAIEARSGPLSSRSRSSRRRVDAFASASAEVPASIRHWARDRRFRAYADEGEARRRSSMAGPSGMNPASAWKSGGALRGTSRFRRSRQAGAGGEAAAGQAGVGSKPVAAGGETGVSSSGVAIADVGSSGFFAPLDPPRRVRLLGGRNRSGIYRGSGWAGPLVGLSAMAVLRPEGDEEVPKGFRHPAFSSRTFRPVWLPSRMGEGDAGGLERVGKRYGVSAASGHVQPVGRHAEVVAAQIGEPFGDLERRHGVWRRAGPWSNWARPWRPAKIWSSSARPPARCRSRQNGE